MRLQPHFCIKGCFLNEANTVRKKISVSQQIESMKAKGISFESFGEERAAEFLTTRNFFFKTKAFSKNFDKWRNADGTSGMYLNLKFEYLVELSKLDAALRELIIGLSLDLEHFIKVELNAAITEDVNCDGFDVVSKFFDFDEARKIKQCAKMLSSESVERGIADLKNQCETMLSSDDEFCAESDCIAIDEMRSYLDALLGGMDFHHLEHSLAHLSNSSYSKKLANKYGVKEPLAAWNYLEMASFGDIISFFKFYFFDYSEKARGISEKKVKPLLFPAKTLRNAAAHNSCLLNGLREKLSKPVGSIAQELKIGYGMEHETVANTRRIPVVHDLSALLICYDVIVQAPGIKRRRAQTMKDLAESFASNIVLEAKQPEVRNVLLFISKLLNTFSARYQKAEDAWSVPQK